MILSVRTSVPELREAIYRSVIDYLIVSEVMYKYCESIWRLMRTDDIGHRVYRAA